MEGRGGDGETETEAASEGEMMKRNWTRCKKQCHLFGEIWHLMELDTFFVTEILFSYLSSNQIKC